MDLGSINWLAVIVCVVVSMISGSLMVQPENVFPHLVGWNRQDRGCHAGRERFHGCHVDINRAFLTGSGDIHVPRRDRHGEIIGRRDTGIRPDDRFPDLARFYSTHVPGQ